MTGNSCLLCSVLLLGFNFFPSNYLLMELCGPELVWKMKAEMGSVNTRVRESKRRFSLCFISLRIFCNYSSKVCQFISIKNKVMVIVECSGAADSHFFEKLVLCPLTKPQCALTLLGNQARQIKLEIINTCLSVLGNMLTAKNCLRKISPVN